MARTDRARDAESTEGPQAVLFDLLMAIMNSLETWSSAADGPLGIAWRDAVTDRMRAAGAYVAYDRDTPCSLPAPTTMLLAPVPPV